jgi:hypothetical protein
MKALFANLSEVTRARCAADRARRAQERRHVHALGDAIQIAVANQQHERASALLKEMHAVVSSALARRHGSRNDQDATR